jgi:prephenate dehydrogenase
LYKSCQVILTPIERSLTKQLQLAQTLWEGLGCKVKLMSPQAHDAAYAAVSHFPHLLAYALMHSVTDQPKGQEFLALAGSGFRDSTRIAASDPQMWRDILLANKTEVLAQSRLFAQSLQKMEALLEENNGLELEALIRSVQLARQQWRLGASQQGDAADV